MSTQPYYGGVDSAGSIYWSKLVRPCDDPHVNFQRIRDQQLWAAREKREAERLERIQRALSK